MAATVVKKIESKGEYKDVMARIHTIMKKGEANTTKAEEKELKKLALMAQEYEKSIYTVPAPRAC